MNKEPTLPTTDELEVRQCARSMAWWGKFLLLIVLLVVGFEIWVQHEIDGYIAINPQGNPDPDLESVYPSHSLMIIPLLALGMTLVGLFGFMLALSGFLSARRRIKATLVITHDD